MDDWLKQGKIDEGPPETSQAQTAFIRQSWQARYLGRGLNISLSR